LSENTEIRQVLHVGCGFNTIENLPAGFRDGTWTEVRFDIDPAVKPDRVGTITQMSEVETESVDALFSSHNIEHVFPHEVPAVLAEFQRVLKPNGFAVITCPDLMTVAEQIVEKGLLEPLYVSPAGPITPLDILYGHIDAVAEGRVYMAHKTGFTEALLRRDLGRAGFSQVGTVRRPSTIDLWALAIKNEGQQVDFTKMFQRFTFVNVREKTAA